MRNYQYEYLFKQSSVPKQITIIYDVLNTITNEELDSESFTFHDSLCSDSQLKFGCCESAYIEFSVGYGIKPLINKELTVYITPEGGTAFLLGRFKVVSDTPTADKRRRDVVAYDKMYELLNMELIGWYDNFWANRMTATVEEFRDSLFNYLNITQQVLTPLCVDSMTITKTVATTSLSGMEVLTSLCEAGLRFGHIVPNRFTYIFRYEMIDAIGDTLYPDQPNVNDVNHLYPIASGLYPKEGSVEEEVGVNGTYISATFEDYFVEPITRLQIRLNENDIGYQDGTGDNIYVIENNFLLYGQSTQALASCYSGAVQYFLSKISFVPANVVAQGNPCLEVGDRIRVHTRHATIDTYILQRTLKGIQSLRDEYVAESPKHRDEKVNGTAHDLKMLRGKSNELTRTIEETNLRITNVESGLQSEITQTEERIQAQITDLQSQIDGESFYYEGHGEPTKHNYPYWDWCTNLQLGDGTSAHPYILLNDIYDEQGNPGGNLYPHFVYTEQNRQDHLRSLYVDLDTGNGYRFVQSTREEPGETIVEWIWKMIQDSNFSYLFNKVSTLEQTVDGISTTVAYDTIQIANHETRIEHNESSITQQATQISLKVTKGDCISDINLTSGQAQINAAKINLNGVTTIGSKVVIGEQDGKIRATDGQFENCVFHSDDGIQSTSQNIKIEGGKLITHDASNNNGIAILNNEIDFYTSYGSTRQFWVGSINTATSNTAQYARFGIYANGQLSRIQLGYTTNSGSEGTAIMMIGDSVGGGNYNYDYQHGDNANIYAFNMKISALHIGGTPPDTPPYTAESATGVLEGFHDSSNLGTVKLVAQDVFLLYMFDNSRLKMSVTRNEGQLIGTWYGTLSGTSDERLKRNIENLSDKVIRAVINIPAKQFIFNRPKVEENGLISIGVIAQDVRSAFEDEGLNPDDYSIVTSYKEQDGKEYYALNYNEYLVARNAYLEQRVDELEKRLARIEELLEGRL